MLSFDVVVIGAGIVGAAFAAALERADVSVAVVEPRPPGPAPDDAAWDSRIYTVSPGNAGWLTTLGVWQRLPPGRVTTVETMLIYGDRAPGRLEFSAYDSGLRELAVTVENGRLQLALWEALGHSSHVTLFPQTQCEDILWERDRARLLLNGASEVETRLVVGADGADSWVRERAGIANHAHDYRQLGVVANFETGEPHEHVAFQWFRDDGVLALLPLPGRRVSMVWSAPDARARQLLALSPDGLCAEVEEASRGAVGALRMITPAAAFALKRSRVARLVEPRVALMGDSAHNVHPLAGQGVNLGLRDARELAAVLAGRAARRDPGDYALLRRYERARREDMLALEWTTDGLEKLFSAPAVWLGGLRNWGLARVDARPLIKKLLVQHAIS